VKVTELGITGLMLVEPRRFTDSRGWFMENWHAERYRDAGIDAEFVQDNVSYSTRNVLRGMHFQEPHPQGKLVWAVTGEIWDVAVDVRADSPTFGAWEGVTLSADNGRQLYLPPGFAHGFVVLSDSAIVTYKCTTKYRPEAERTLRWDDPEIGIDWPVREPVLSEKDRRGVGLAEVRAGLYIG